MRWAGEGLLWYWNPEGGAVLPGWTLVAQTSRFTAYGYESLAVRVGLGHLVAMLVWLWWELRFPWFFRRQRELWAEFRASKGLIYTGLHEDEQRFWHDHRRKYGQHGPKPLSVRIVEAVSYVLGR